MDSLSYKVNKKVLRKKRIRSVVKGTSERPRLSVFVSAYHVSAQIIDDDAQKTLVSATTMGQKAATGHLTNKAAWVGQEIAKKALGLKIGKIVFDRNGRLYHGRVKALAEAARKEGLEF